MSQPTDSPLSQHEIQRIFRDQIAPTLFSAAAAQEQPSVTLVGGQPASGKSRAVGDIIHRYGGTDIVPILGDELRAFHPGYRQMMKTDPLSMPALTAQASAAWVEMSIDFAREQRVNVLIEGTFRRPAVTLGTAEGFAEAGYSTHLVALAVPGVVSRLSAMTRYVDADTRGEAARWSDLSAHEAGYHGSALTLTEAARSPHVSRITVVSRDGDILFDAARPAPLDRAVTALDAARQTILPIEAARTWLAQFEAGYEHLRASGQINQATQPLLEQLSSDAITVKDGLTLALARERSSQAFAYGPKDATRHSALSPRPGSHRTPSSAPDVDLSR